MSDKLNRFGEFIVTNLRDKGLDFFEQLERRLWKSESLKSLQNKMNNFSVEELAIIRECVKLSVDNAIHDFLFALRENVDIKVIVDDENVASLIDGLNGEIFFEYGWFANYSKYGE